MAKEQETSDFASVGSAPFPPTYEDSKRISDISQWSEKIVRNKRQAYESFLERDDPMPRARKFAKHILNHLVFEDEFNRGEESFKNWIEMEQRALKVVEDEQKPEDSGN